MIESQENQAFRSQQSTELEENRLFRSEQRLALADTQARQIQKVVREEGNIPITRTSIKAHLK
jgi:hypothetical protein